MKQSSTLTKAALTAENTAAFERQVRGYFKAQQRQSRIVFRRQAFGVVEAARATPPQPWDPAFDTYWAAVTAATDSILEVAFIDAANLALEAGGTEALRQAAIGLKFDLENPRAVQWIEENGAWLVAGVTDTTKEALRKIIADGLADGQSYAQIAKSIATAFDEFSRTRAQLISITEVGNAYEAGAQQAAQVLASGFPMEKSWLTAEDDRVEEECAGNAMDGWLPLDANFSSGDMRPLAHPRCRCTCLYRRAVMARAA